jgi:hypothetical protein
VIDLLGHEATLVTVVTICLSFGDFIIAHQLISQLERGSNIGDASVFFDASLEPTKRHIIPCHIIMETTVAIPFNAGRNEACVYSNKRVATGLSATMYL